MHLSWYHLFETPICEVSYRCELQLHTQVLIVVDLCFCSKEHKHDCVLVLAFSPSYHICTKLDWSTKDVRCSRRCNSPSYPNKHEIWYWLLKDGCGSIQYGRHTLEPHLASKLSRTGYLQNMDRKCASRYSSLGLCEPNLRPMLPLLFLYCCHHAYGRKPQL
jgi:hypothetical protein